MSVRVQAEDFDIGAEIEALRQGRTDIGAICSFVGTVRDVPLALEHYPGMTERALEQIYIDAQDRFDMIRGRIVHRFGPLQPSDNIVLVIALSRHRQAAFDAANYMMDRLKTDAPFWKLENDTWVEQRAGDVAAAKSWHQS